VTVWPVVLVLVGACLVIGLLSLVFVGSERVTRRLTRGRQPERDDDGTGAGELFGELLGEPAQDLGSDVGRLALVVADDQVDVDAQQRLGQQIGPAQVAVAPGPLGLT
jgi:hypothetical protein